MRTYASWAFAALVAMGAGCGDDAPSTNDSGVIDSGASDVGVVDSGSADSGSADSGSADSGSADSGSVDSGSVDSGSVDSGSVDSGSVDSGSADSGSADSGTSDAGAQEDAAPEDGGAECVGRPAACVSGTSGGACGDALSPPECVAGEWRCPMGKIPVTECACVGRPPGMCTCGPSGWECDGGL